MATRSIMACTMVAALSLPCVAADAPGVETVQVDGSALIGVWKITFPEYVKKSGVFQPFEFGPLKDRYCRIERSRSDLTIGCVGVWGEPGTTSVGDGKLHFAWGSMMARIVMDATLQSVSNFTGTFKVKLAGIAIDDPQQSAGTKLTLSGNLPDEGKKSQLLTRLLNEMAKGTPAEQFDARPHLVRLMTPGELRPLGEVQSVIYLGVFDTPPDPRGPKKGVPQTTLSVYDVEFAGGERLCALHQRDDGVVDGFGCV